VRQQLLLVLGEDRGVEAAFRQVDVQVPAVEQAVLELLAEGTLAAHRVQGDQQRGLEQPLSGTEVRSAEAYTRSNSGDNGSKAASTTALIRRNGWSRGTRSSKSDMAGMQCWGLGGPLIGDSSVAKGTCPNRHCFSAACLGPRALLCMVSIRSGSQMLVLAIAMFPAPFVAGLAQVFGVMILLPAAAGADKCHVAWPLAA
jgi:hypothetical protein